MKSTRHRDLSNYYKKRNRKKLFSVEKASGHHCVKDILNGVFFHDIK